MNKAKKIFGCSVRVLSWVLVAFAIFMMIFTVFTVTAVDRNDRSIFGRKFYIVQTDSMSKSDKNADLDVHFGAGDIVIIKIPDDPSAMQAGDVIAFVSVNSESYGETVTHMIREVRYSEHGEVLGYVTYGTNTGVDDGALVEPMYVIGKYTGKLAGVGNFFAFVKSTPGYIVCILVPFLLLILYNGVNVIRLFGKYKREQTEEMQAERDKLEAERAENKRMMEELLELKAQMAQMDGTENQPVKPASETVSAQENNSVGETDGK